MTREEIKHQLEKHRTTEEERQHMHQLLHGNIKNLPPSAETLKDIEDFRTGKRRQRTPNEALDEIVARSRGKGVAPKYLKKAKKIRKRLPVIPNLSDREVKAICDIVGKMPLDDFKRLSKASKKVE